MLYNALTQDKLQYLLAWYPHPPKSIADSFTSCLFSTFNFAISTVFFLSRHDGDSHPGHHARWKSLPYKLHRMRDYLLSLTALVLARDLCIMGWTFATFYGFLLGKPFFQTMSWVLSLAAFYQLRSTFSNKEQRTNQSVIYYRCSGIIINNNVKCP